MKRKKYGTLNFHKNKINISIKINHVSSSDIQRSNSISSTPRGIARNWSTSPPPDLLRVHLPREETVTEVSRMEHRCFRPPPICCLRMADSQSSFPFHLIPFCGNTISTQSFARVCMRVSLSLSPWEMDGWRGGVGVFETSDTRSEIRRGAMAESSIDNSGQLLSCRY